jgi:ABC-type transporter Mla subunit MlaD
MSQHNDLRPFLVDVFQELKEQQSALGALMDQVAALRDVLANASPEFSRQFSERLEYWQTQGASLKAETAAAFDATIQRLKEQ